MNLSQIIQMTPAASQWSKIGIRHHHGICLPVFSLRSANSCGIGEYLDLLPIISWCSRIGLDVIQLLPINDNGSEASPYSSLSAHALNPLFLSLYALPHWHKAGSLRGIYSKLQSLNTLQRIDYKQVHTLKDLFLKIYFKEFSSEIIDSAEYKDYKTSTTWLPHYAMFKALKIKRNWQFWIEWPEEWREPFEEDSLADDCELHCFIQYLCFQQMKLVHEEAKKQELLLKGDIPILISKDSADVWEHQSLFKMHYNAGAPPDMFNPEGQDWGFPVYDWDAIEKDGYEWWKNRLKTASPFFDLYRIDHIVGFYRIWAVATGLEENSKGFIPADPALWIAHGEKIMRVLLASTEMLPIGEDLGTVPPEVRKNLRMLGIAGTKVMRWERRWEEDKSYIAYKDYEPISLTTVSTHDSETLQLWWKNQPEEAREFCLFKGWEWDPELSKTRHRDILYDSHHTASLFHINLLQEYLALVPNRCWPNREDERINVPGTISETNWSYRFKPTIEEIVADEPLSEIIKELIR